MLQQVIQPEIPFVANQHTRGWTDERVEELKKLWADGLSASQIAGKMGGVTRNGVIGKVHRLKLDGRPKPISVGAKKESRRRHGGVLRSIHSKMRMAELEADAEPDIEPSVFDMQIPAEQRKTVLELTHETCKWPIGDPKAVDFFFCGGKPITGCTYCSHHLRRAHQPPRPRKKAHYPIRRNAA